MRRKRPPCHGGNHAAPPEEHCFRCWLCTEHCKCDAAEQRWETQAYTLGMCNLHEDVFEGSLLGCDVKIGFGDPRTGCSEYMWLQVRRYNPKTDRYVGVLANCPLEIEAVEEGDLVEFCLENVCAVSEPPPSPLPSTGPLSGANPNLPTYRPK